MTVPAAPVRVGRCESCHSRFLPRAGLCPKCGSSNIVPHEIAAEGRVLAATELALPPPGWGAPHRLALIELAEGVRLLAVLAGDLPAREALVSVSSESGHYIARVELAPA